MRVRGYFNVVQNDDNKIRLAINLNGNTNELSQMQRNIIYSENSAGTLVNNTLDNVQAQVQALIDANNGLYEQRRVAWVKLQFIPKYTNFTAAAGDGETPNALVNCPVFVYSESNGCDQPLASITLPQLMTEVTGVKRKNLFKSFKVFRRSRKYPMFQKYAAINLSTQNQPSGQWLDSGSTNNLDAPHTIIYAEGLEFNAGDTLFECMFEYKLQWQDRSSSTV